MPIWSSYYKWAQNTKTTSNNNGIQRQVSNKKCASAVGCSCYIFQISCSINSKWQFLDCVTIAFSKWYYWFPGLCPSSSTTNRTQCARYRISSTFWWKGPKAPMHVGLFTTANLNDSTTGPIIELSHWQVTRWGCTSCGSIRKSISDSVSEN